MRKGGFTLVELMIVVAIIAIIAAIAIPSLQQSRKLAIETVVIGTLRAIVTANEQYRTRFGVYANPIDQLSAEYLPQTAGNSSLDEYLPAYSATGGSYWELQARPKNPGVTADRSFWVSAAGVIRVEFYPFLATSTSQPLD